MFFRPFRARPLLCMVVWVLSSQSVAFGQERPQSLYEKRLSIIRGTSPGIVIYGGEKPAVPAPAAVPAPVPVTAASAPKALQVELKPAAQAVPQEPSKSEFISTLPRLSGRSMNTARSLGTGDEGIKIPTARSASQPIADPVAKP